MTYTQQLDCSEWQFKNIPEFKGGQMTPVFADCGTGLSRIPDFKSKDNSFMHTFDGVSAESISEYANELEKGGFRKVFENKIDGNLFYQFAVGEGLLYISFLSVSKKARIILDRCKSTDIGSFGYSDYESVSDDTVIAQYSLHYHKMIKGTTCDCGMNYVIRLHDNSLIIIDGGEMEQSTDIAIADYLKFLHELTGTQDGEKMTVSLWLCTHAHNDHCDFFAKLIRFHSDEIEVERVAFNFPNPKNVRNSNSVNALKQRLVTKYPNADFAKLHAGAKFSIANAEIEVFLSNEDTVGVDEEDDDPFPGTNSTSVIFRVTADGVNTLFLADCGTDNGAILIDNFGKDKLDCELLQAAHHGINSIYDVYERIDTQKVLLPQCPMNMDTRFSDVYDHLRKRYSEENICFADEYTYIFPLKDGKYTQAQREHIGTAYDKSDW